MGLFDKKMTDEQLAAQEANKDLLNKFNATEVLGVKKDEGGSKLFIYDEDMKAFVIADGPQATYKERNPYVIRFDQVEDVWLEVDEWWSEEGKKFDKYHDYHILTQDNYSKVYWHYDFYMNFKTTHPCCPEIRYQMNYSTNILKVPGFHLFVHRGLELNGTFRGPEIKENRIRIEDFCTQIQEGLKDEKLFDIITRQRPDGIMDKMRKDMTDDWFVSRIDNVAKHLRRAGKISKIINAK